MKNLIYSFLFVIIQFGCSDKVDSDKVVGDKIVEEYTYQEIKLSGEISKKESEISGLAWLNDNLVFLTQYPGNYGEGETGVLWCINKEEIYSAINDSSVILKPTEIRLLSNGLGNIINSRGSGLEAIIFDKDTAYISIENSGLFRTNGIIVKGIINSDFNEISLIENSKIEINHSVNITNFAEETLTQSENEIISIYEGNGKKLYPGACAHVISKRTWEAKKIPMPSLEYRITDATEIDERGDFWVINYLYPGDENKMKLSPDSVFIKHGIGKTHKVNKQVERLVKLNFNGKKISLANTPPIQLKLEQDSESNNWEGLVKLDDKGFLLITDRYPGTKFVFLKYNSDM